jgi:hypothetical protein
MRSSRWVHAGYIIALAVSFTFAVDGRSVTYKVDEKKYEGYFIDAGKNAPFILLIHDWDGLNDYEIKRANMLSKL